MRDGEVDVFFAMGGNFVAAAPDTDATAAALARCRLTVQVSTKLNRSHVLGGQAALILPCLGRTERDVTGGHQQFVTVEDSMGMVHATSGGNPPASEHLRSEVAIVCALAPGDARRPPRHRLGRHGRATTTASATTSQRVVPGFDDFNERVRVPGGFTLPNAARDSRTFATASGKAELTVNTFEPIEVPPGPAAPADGPLARPVQHDDLRARRPLPRHQPGPAGRVRAARRPRRARARRRRRWSTSSASGATAPSGGRPSFRVVGYPVAAGTCAAYFPEANVLVPLDSTADRSGTPTSKSVVVRLEPI